MIPRTFLIAIFGLCTLGWMSLSSPAVGQEIQTLTVSQAGIGTAMENRTPQGVAETFSSDVERLYAFSKITGISEDTIVRHLWFYGDRMMAEIRLSVKPPAWRTYSSKQILPSWTGAWRIEITDEDGKVLKTLPFTVE